MPETTRTAFIAVVDIEASSARTDFVKRMLRRSLKDILLAALGDSGIDPGKQLIDIIDRGDGAAVLLEATTTRDQLTARFALTLREQLRLHALGASAAHTIRLRLALNIGEISRDQPGQGFDGWSGDPIDEACRIVDLPLLRALLTEVPEAYLVLGIPDDWYHKLEKSGRSDLHSFRSAPFQAKERSGTVHVQLPGLETPSLPMDSALPDPPLPTPAEPEADHPPTHVSVGRDYIARDKNTTIHSSGANATFHG
ncbi:hypothetical protein [Kineosporia babensis]|uniref:Uncharacterized protein n=1 Tax=Kineosporia babensis TaxID=499548 RepID=A0A9X1NDE1_9ACTN|nr:hypothetical protein [Kineosporia babensis]MCD5312050.1 hypothetical protein [Kineosporia babensis]